MTSTLSLTSFVDSMMYVPCL